MFAYERVIAGLVHSCAEDGKKKAQHGAMVGDIQPQHLFYKKAEPKQHGDLILLAESDTPPEGYELATEDSLRANVPYENYYTWVRERVGSLPVLSSPLLQ